MKYGDLVQFAAIAGRVRLAAADQEEGARDLVGRQVVSPALAERLTGAIFPQLDPEAPAGAKLLLIVGPRGVGKSHLLAAVSALAERADLVSARPAPIPSGAPGSVGADAVAGRFQVIRVELERETASLRTVVLGRMAALVRPAGGKDDAVATPISDPIRLEDLLAAFQHACPEQGLLVVLDDLRGFLAARKRRELGQELAFLSQLGGACGNSRLRVIASVEASLWAQPLPGAAADSLRSLEACSQEVALRHSDGNAVVGARLVRKTPAQRAQVAAHLARFAGCHGGWRERMDEFIDLFPIHPDCLALFDGGVLRQLRGGLPVLSELIAARLEDPVPEDGPGLIAGDSLWSTIAARLKGQPESEFSALLRFSDRLEHQLPRSSVPVEIQDLARTLARALLVRRAAAPDPYSEAGATAAELRDSLGVPAHGIDLRENDAADRLLLRLREALGQIRSLAGDSVLTVRDCDDRFELHFQKFRRFQRPELFLHWVNAVPFLLLMVTGGIMLGSRFSQLDREMFTWTVAIHKACAVTWLGALPLSVLARFAVHWEHLRLLFRWGGADATWMIQSFRSLYHKGARIPPAGRFNTGQKINACLVALYYFGFVATGVLMYAKGSILFPWYVHTALFFATLGSVGGHLFLALVNPGTRIAIGGIFHGWAPLRYIEHHHVLSLPKALQAQVPPISVGAIAAEVVYSRLELAILLVTVVLAGGGFYAFGQGRMATVKRQFVRSFSDVIQPSQLTTKHRIGPTADACTKCHLYSGELSDAKCESCHADIKARRAQQSGYHGNLEGDCRTCHREHRERTAPLVPPLPAKFKHDEALFPLAGKHAAVKCDECHQKPRPPDTHGIYYLGLSHESCTDCHRDQHTAQFVGACDTCHSPRGWTGRELAFSHATGSDFALQGRHAEAECRQCHQPASPAAPLGSASFKGLPRDCVGCHTDPHHTQFATRCRDCHSTTGWHGKNLDFDHNQDSAFPLTARHAPVACDRCHVPERPGAPLGQAQFRGLKKGCADCHKDPHQSQLPPDCTRCHPTPAGWNVGAPQFVHDRDTTYALHGKHAAVDCIRCHQPRTKGGTLATARFKGLETACEKCHAVEHPASYGSTCTACHSPKGWPPKSPTFDHRRDFRFELAGKHLLAQCSACHNSTLMGRLDVNRRPEFTCVDCHRKDNPHRDSLGDNCAKCHSSIGWKGEDLVFDHNTMARFALDRDHVNVACVKCHENGRWKPIDPACANCHPKFFLDARR